MQNIGQDSVRRLLFPWPPMRDQKAVVAAVARVSTDIDELQARTSAQVERLREYRQALITAAVTGQLDIAAGEPAASVRSFAEP